MIERLRLVDLQCHEKLDVVLQAGVNVIAGPSDVGKSAVARGLRWLCLNRPGAAGLLRHDAKTVAVRVKIDGKMVERSSGPGFNGYRIGKAEFAAIGKDVPEAVADLLNVSDLNFQGQHDAPFWFADTPGQVAKSLNAIIDLGGIDDALSSLASSVRLNQSAATISQTRFDDAAIKFDSLHWVSTAEEKLEEVEALHLRATKNRGEFSRINDAVRRAVGLIELAEKTRGRYTAGVQARDIAERAAEAAEAADKIGGLVRAAKALQIILAKPLPDTAGLIAKSLAADVATIEASKLRRLVIAAIQAKSKTDDLAMQLSESKAELAKVKTCPKCGNPIQSR